MNGAPRAEDEKSTMTRAERRAAKREAAAKDEPKAKDRKPKRSSK